MVATCVSNHVPSQAATTESEATTGSKGLGEHNVDQDNLPNLLLQSFRTFTSIIFRRFSFFILIPPFTRILMNFLIFFIAFLTHLL